MNRYDKNIWCFFIIISACFNLFGQTFQLNGNVVKLDVKCYQLTPDVAWKMGSMWNLTKVNLNNSFDIQAELNLGCHDNNGADGIVFGLQQLSTSAGNSGGGLGFEKIKPSVGVEFDTYQNGGDPAYDHIAIIKNGVIYHNQGGTLAGPVQASPTSLDIEDCKYHTVRFVWNAGTKTLSVYFDCFLRINYTGDIVNTVFGGNPDVYWGFTAATGDLANDQRVCLNYISFQNKLRDTTICKGEKVQLTATGGSSYSWSPSYNISSPGIANPVVFPDTTTTYFVSFPGACGITNKDSVKITVNPPKQPSIFSAGTYCVADIADTLLTDLTGGVWSGKGITDSIKGIFSPFLADTGKHIISYTPKGKCTVKNTASVVISAFKVSVLSSPAPLCIYSPPVLLKATPTGGVWSGEGITDSSAGTFNPSVAAKGIHNIAYTTYGKCGNTGTITITVNAADASILPPPVFCSTDTTVHLNSVNSGGIWNGKGITDSIAGIFNPSLAGAGMHSITYSILDDCIDTDTGQVTVVSPRQVHIAGNTFLPCNETITISAREQFNDYRWNDNSNEQSLTVKSAGSYFLTVTDSNGCISSDTVTITADSCLTSTLWLPNVFTPNKDGKNELFSVVSMNLTRFEAYIFNRWGEQLYEWHDAEGGWDGTFCGKPCPDGVYVYIIRTRGIDQKKYDKAGHLTLIR